MKKNFIFLVFFLFLVNCQSAKDALTLKKKPASDEFLVEKKSPLVLPPDYGELPIPNEYKEINNQTKNEQIDISSGQDEISINKTIKNSPPTSLEKSILKKIK